MQPINPTCQSISQQFYKIAADANSMNASDRGRAEAQIKEYQDRVDQQNGFMELLMHIVASGHTSSLFFSIVLKNTVSQCWNASTAEHCVQEIDKAVVRQSIISLMLRSPTSIQRNLAETIAIIADVDFPSAWPDALAVLQGPLTTEWTVHVQCAALSTAHSILQKYRTKTELSDTIVSELRTIYSTLLDPLLQSMNFLLGIAETTTGADGTLACKGVTFAVECVLDMTSMDLGDEFILSLDKIVTLYLRCVVLTGGRFDMAALIELKSVVVFSVTHFLNRFDEDFVKHAEQFLKVVWDLVADSSSRSAEMDDLTIRALELLSSAVRGTTRSVFSEHNTLQSLIDHVAIPNLMLQDEDIEMYEHEPDAYIQRDIEGSDFHTRRRAAGELVSTMMSALPATAGPLLRAVVDRLFAESAANWKSKDAAIYLASILALGGQHADVQRGATQQLSALISFEDFLSHSILPELFSAISAASPSIIKADCMRVVSTFRTHIAPSLIFNLLSALPVWLASDEPVVMTYAAHALERLLLVQHNDEFAITEAVFASYARPVLHTLCTRVSQCQRPNAYLLQCLMRICLRLPGCISPFVGDIVLCLAAVLGEAAKNPSHPLFSHCLFEVLSKCIALHPHQGPSIEQALWDKLIFVLSNDVVEYVPYVLQILAQLLDTYPKGSEEPPQQYHSLLEPLTQVGSLQQKGNIPAVVRLLVSFIAGYPAFVHKKGHSEKVLNCFRILLQLKNYDHEGLNLLTAMMLSYPHETMGMYLTTVFQLLMARLQASKTPKYVRILIIFMSMTVVARGATDVVERMNSLQPGLFFMLLDKVWLPNMQKITGALERKVCIVALANLLCDCQLLQGNQQAWASSVFSCLKMIHTEAEQDDYTSFSPKTQTMQDLSKQVAEDGGFTNVFCPLKEAGRDPVDVCPQVTNPDLYFREHMQQLLRGSGAPLIGVLQSFLTPDLLALIQ